MPNEQTVTLQASSLNLKIGPLNYRLQAYDTWGGQALDLLAAHVTCEETEAQPDRIIHLVSEENPTAADTKQGRLPSNLLALVPEALAQGHWQKIASPLETVWRSPQTTHTFWSAVKNPVTGAIRFPFPWGLIIHDIIARGGGLAHAGLASFQGSGLLFLAPPSGGKSTTLRTAPPNWKVFSDDAALVWPNSDGDWQASPLPAWGNMIRPEEDWLYPQLALGQSCRLKSLVLLQKAKAIRLKALLPITVVPKVFRAFSEYPAAAMTATDQQESLFRMSAQMTRELACWQLALPRHGDIWPLLVEEAA